MEEERRKSARRIAEKINRLSEEELSILISYLTIMHPQLLQSPASHQDPDAEACR